MSLVSAGQAVVFRSHACGELKKLSNQLKERGSVHGPLGHDALTPAKSTKPLATKNNNRNTTCKLVAVVSVPPSGEKVVHIAHWT